MLVVPDQSIEAVQLVALVVCQLMVLDPPLAIFVGLAVKVSVGALEVVFTVMVVD